jgi:hypothetical protein
VDVKLYDEIKRGSQIIYYDGAGIRAVEPGDNSYWGSKDYQKSEQTLRFFNSNSEIENTDYSTIFLRPSSASSYTQDLWLEPKSPQGLAIMQFLKKNTVIYYILIFLSTSILSSYIACHLLSKDPDSVKLDIRLCALMGILNIFSIFLMFIPFYFLHPKDKRPGVGALLSFMFVFFSVFVLSNYLFAFLIYSLLSAIITTML